MQIELILSPQADLIQALYQGLDAYNRSHLPSLTTSDIALLIKSLDGTLVGGLAGQVLGHTLQIKYLWVETSLRHQGWGSLLLQRAQQFAQEQGLRSLCLDTYSFQAPVFYLNAGFEEIGRYRDYISFGVDKIFFEKLL